jgi:hypothetical protein
VGAGGPCCTSYHKHVPGLLAFANEHIFHFYFPFSIFLPTANLRLSEPIFHINDAIIDYTIDYAIDYAH